MQKAVLFQTTILLIGSLVTLIIDDGPAPKLWHDFPDDLVENLRVSMNRVQAVGEALRHIDKKLQLHRKDNEQANLPPAIHHLTELERTRGAFNRREQKAFANENEGILTQEERAIYSTIVDSVTLNRSGAYMAGSPAGTGKTVTEKVIAARLRWDGRVVPTVVSTGIAALQLPGGWTAHSMYKLPLQDNSVPGALCNIRGKSKSGTHPQL